MGWREPDYEGEFPSLGPQICDWLEEYLTIPRGPLYGKPFRLTDEQYQIVVRFYRLNPQTGGRAYRRGCVRRSKGWGKDPLLAALSIAEFCGPTVFDGWDADGEPVGREHYTPWVQVAGLSEEAADANTYSLVHAMLSESTLVDECGLDVGLTRILRKGKPGCKIEPVSAAAGTREGQPITFACLGETHLWVQRNSGVKLAAVLLRNIAKNDGTSFESTNAHVPGERSVAERTYQAANANIEGIFYDALEAPEVTDDDIRSGSDKVKAAVRVAYGQASWVNLDRIVAEGKDPSVDLSDFRRFYLSQLVKGESRAVDPAQWATLKKKISVPEGSRVSLGFDGSISGDATALIGCTEDGHLFEVKIWERPNDSGTGGWRVPRSEVHDTVAAAFERWDVGAFWCDPPKWYTEIDVWHETYGDRVVAFDTNTRPFLRATDRFLTAVKEGTLSHDGSQVLSEHVLAAELQKARSSDPDNDARTLYKIVKPADGRKIDACVAAVNAYEGSKFMVAASPDFTPLVSIR